MIATIRRGSRVSHHIDYVSLLQNVSTGVGAMTFLYGIVRMSLAAWDRGKLLARVSAAQQETREIRAAAEAYRLSSEGWKSAFEQITAEIGEIKLKLASAVIYIGALVTHVREGGTESALPAIPLELQEDVTAVLDRRAT